MARTFAEVQDPFIYVKTPDGTMGKVFANDNNTAVHWHTSRDMGNLDMKKLLNLKQLCRAADIQYDRLVGAKLQQTSYKYKHMRQPFQAAEEAHHRGEVKQFKMNRFDRETNDRLKYKDMGGKFVRTDKVLAAKQRFSANRQRTDYRQPRVREVWELDEDFPDFPPPVQIYPEKKNGNGNGGDERAAKILEEMAVVASQPYSPIAIKDAPRQDYEKFVKKQPLKRSGGRDAFGRRILKFDEILKKKLPLHKIPLSILGPPKMDVDPVKTEPIWHGDKSEVPKSYYDPPYIEDYKPMQITAGFGPLVTYQEPFVPKKNGNGNGKQKQIKGNCGSGPNDSCPPNGSNGKKSKISKKIELVKIKQEKPWHGDRPVMISSKSKNGSSMRTPVVLPPSHPPSLGVDYKPMMQGPTISSLDPRGRLKRLRRLEDDPETGELRPLKQRKYVEGDVYRTLASNTHPINRWSMDTHSSGPSYNFEDDDYRLRRQGAVGSSTRLSDMIY